MPTPSPEARKLLAEAAAQYARARDPKTLAAARDQLADARRNAAAAAATPGSRRN